MEPPPPSMLRSSLPPAPPPCAEPRTRSPSPAFLSSHRRLVRRAFRSHGSGLALPSSSAQVGVSLRCLPGALAAGRGARAVAGGWPWRRAVSPSPRGFARSAQVLPRHNGGRSTRTEHEAAPPHGPRLAAVLRAAQAAISSPCPPRPGAARQPPASSASWLRAPLPPPPHSAPRPLRRE